MSSPVVIDGHLYLHLRNRRFTCIDLKSGQEKWITKPFGEYWSLIARGDRILALDEKGELLLIRANPEAFELLDRRQVTSESSWAHLANDGEQLFVRDLLGLTAYRWAEERWRPALTAQSADLGRRQPAQDGRLTSNSLSAARRERSSASADFVI